MTTEQFLTHLRTKNFRDWLIVTLARETSLTVEEIIAIRKNDLCDHAITRHDGSHVVISDELWPLLQEQRQLYPHSWHLFLTRNEQAVHPSGIRQTIRQLSQRLGANITLSQLLTEQTA